MFLSKLEKILGFGNFLDTDAANNTEISRRDLFRLSTLVLLPSSESNQVKKVNKLGKISLFDAVENKELRKPYLEQLALEFVGSVNEFDIRLYQNPREAYDDTGNKSLKAIINDSDNDPFFVPQDYETFGTKKRRQIFIFNPLFHPDNNESYIRSAFLFFFKLLKNEYYGIRIGVEEFDFSHADDSALEYLNLLKTYHDIFSDLKRTGPVPTVFRDAWESDYQSSYLEVRMKFIHRKQFHQVSKQERRIIEYYLTEYGQFIDEQLRKMGDVQFYNLHRDQFDYEKIEEMHTIAPGRFKPLISSNVPDNYKTQLTMLLNKEAA